MPQKWQEYWPINNPAVKDEKNNVIEDKNQAEEIRGSAVYEIGNMALLVTNLNTTIRNYEFKRKMEGEGKKAGVKTYDYLLYTKEITSLYDSGKIWDETESRSRTSALTEKIIARWSIN